MSADQLKIKPYRGIIFDMDGTLTRTNQLIYDTFNYVTQKYTNRKYTPGEITAMFGPPEDVPIKNLVGDSDFESAMKDFYTYYKEHHNEKAEIYEGIIDILKSLTDNGIRLSLFTGKGRVSTEITLEEFNLSKYFRAVVTGHDVRRHKPSGEGIQHALQIMEVSSGDAIMVGDSVADVKASLDAGVDIATVLWDSYGYAKVVNLDTTFKFLSIEEFRQWVDELIKHYN